MFAARVATSVICQTAIFGLLLFLPAGTVHWWRAWVFLMAVGVATAGSMVYVFRDNEELLRERHKPPVQKGQPRIDKILVLLFLLTFMGVNVFIPLDVFHFHLMGTPGPSVSALGLVLFLAGWSVAAAAMRANTFAATVVRHQEERRQTVVDTGAYAVVRHPMYAGAAVLLAGMPLWLGSKAALVAAVVPMTLLVVRTVFEEKFLRQHLDGYDAYMGRVRYRLLPFVW